MAAYAALVSLENIIHDLQNHSHPPITLHKQQARLLVEKLTFFQEFLKVYNPTLPYTKEADLLESRIARAAYAAEDAIESHAFDKLNKNGGGKMSIDSFYAALEKVTEDMDLIEKEAMEIKEALEFNSQLLQTKSTPPADSSRSAASSTAKTKSMMVGADDLLLEMKKKLTSNANNLQTISIVGMGGSGKTTLALNIYQDGLIKEHFDIRAWFTISQEYSLREIFIQLLTQLIKEFDQLMKNFDRDLSEGELGEMLYKHLYGRKYMVILDDMWDLKAWDGVRRYLPNNENGSRIVITTRLTTLASTLSNSNCLGMKLLDEDDSWDLLSKTVFGEKGCCPSGLEEIGKKIGKSCKGLPLSIVVVGGLLAKSEQSIESWEHMEGNLNAIVNLEDDERCLKILYMSYKQLPIHLKPCFLYMGIYHEDCVIRTSKIVKLWVCEGFLKPVSGKMPEVLAREYLRELIGRNLIMIHELGSIGSIKECKVHDLIRDLCLREARKEGLYTVYPGQEIKDDKVDRIVISGTVPEIEEVDAALSSARSLILTLDYKGLPPDHVSRLLRMVVTLVDWRSRIKVKPFFNSRSLTFHHGNHWVPSSIRVFWNPRTSNVCFASYDEKITATTDIWHMSHTRYINGDFFYLPNPPPNVEDGNVLENLQSLVNVDNFRCSERMVKAIPNIRKLQIHNMRAADDMYSLTNLDRLDKLESLKCNFKQPATWRINFPQSLTKLYLGIGDSQCWDDQLDKIGALPLLQKLTLCNGTFKEGKWETSEGQFRSLKFLYCQWFEALEVWISEASHFPRLEQLYLFAADELVGIPSDFADISTLRLIQLVRCSDYTIESAKRILEEQEALYEEEETTLQIHAQLQGNDPALVNLRSRNFHVTLVGGGGDDDDDDDDDDY